MTEASKSRSPSLGHYPPRVVVVERDADYGQLLASILQERFIRAKHFRTVSAFLDLNCQEHIDLVILEVDAMDPDTLDNIIYLRTHFGEGPGTRIITYASFLLGAFSILAERSGADVLIRKQSAPEAMAATLETAIDKWMASREIVSSFE